MFRLWDALSSFWYATASKGYFETGRTQMVAEQHTYRSQGHKLIRLRRRDIAAVDSC
jgi:hypothetical protein